jgi:hypothetical protein
MTDMKEYGLMESASVKIQTLKTAIEVCLASICPREELMYSPLLYY